MPKVRLTPTDDPDIVDMEEVETPTLGDFLIDRVNDQAHKLAEQDSLLGRILMRLDSLEKARSGS